MPNYFLTFSPSHKWSCECTMYVFYIIVDYYKRKKFCKSLYGTTSGGSDGDHFHFHFHIFDTDRQGRAIRTSLIKLIQYYEEIIPQKEYILRIERQKGKMTSVINYMEENNKQLYADDDALVLKNLVFKSENYDKDMALFSETDKVLTHIELFKKLSDVLYEQRAKHGGIDRHLIHTAFEKLAREYYLYRIDQRVIARMLEDFERQYKVKRTYTFSQL